MSDPRTIDGSTPTAPKITLARIGVISGKAPEPSEWVNVHFNPTSLQLQINGATQQPSNEARKQYTPRFTSKLTMELPFDTTDSGNDVTITTRKLQAFIAAPGPAGKQGGGASAPPQPPLVMFQWGLLKFKGIVESYKETLDFFSANGVPLRASVNMTLTQPDRVFDNAAPGKAAAAPEDTALDTRATTAADAANSGEAPAAARAVAQSNGLESLRFGDGSPLTVNPSVTLKPPAAFASAAAGGGLGLGINAGAGISAGVSAGISGGISAGATAGVSGLSRLSATEGAFAALQVSASPGASAVRLNTSSLMPQTTSAGVAADGNATFNVGGRAMLQGGAGLRADVGAGADARARVTFD